MKHCDSCGDWFPDEQLNEAGYCELCAPIMKLRETLKAQGKVRGKPIVREAQASLPYADA
jgi:hypothetical protein